MKKYLYKKQLRDIKKQFGLHSVLFFISLLGMVFFGGLTAVQTDLQATLEQFYQASNLTDYTVRYNLSLVGQGIDDAAYEAIKESQEFAAVEVSQYLADIHIPTLGRAYLHYLKQDDATINLPQIKSGNMPTQNDEMLIDYEYAKAKKIALGNQYSISGKIYRVVGLAVFPDYLYKGGKIPDYQSTAVVKIYTDEPLVYNQLLIKTTKSEAEVRDILASKLHMNLSFTTVTPIEKDVSYIRIHTDLSLINELIFIFPIICMLTVVFILFTNYTKMIAAEHRNIGILKANGFSFLQVYSHYLLAPISYIPIAGIIGTSLGVSFIPQIYIGLLAKFYTLPHILTINPISKIVFPTILLFVVTICTITLACFFTIRQKPVDLMGPQERHHSPAKVLSHIKLPFHWKLVVRNTITYRKKTMLMILCSGLCLSILMAAFIVEDSIDETQKIMNDEIILADYRLSYQDTTHQTVVNQLSGADSVFENIYCMYEGSAGLIYDSAMHPLRLYDAINPYLKLIDAFNQEIPLQTEGIYLPLDRKTQYQLSIGDEIQLSFGDKKAFLSARVAGFYQGVAELDLVASYQYIFRLLKDYPTIMDALQSNINTLVKLKPGVNKETADVYLQTHLKPDVRFTNTLSDIHCSRQWQMRLAAYSASEVLNYLQVEASPAQGMLWGGSFFTMIRSQLLECFIEAADEPIYPVMDLDDKPLDTTKGAIYLAETFQKDYQINDKVTFSLTKETSVTLTVSGFFQKSACPYSVIIANEGLKEAVTTQAVANALQTLYDKFTIFFDLKKGYTIDEYEAFVSQTIPFVPQIAILDQITYQNAYTVKITEYPEEHLAPLLFQNGMLNIHTLHFGSAIIEHTKSAIPLCVYDANHAGIDELEALDLTGGGVYLHSAYLLKGYTIGQMIHLQITHDMTLPVMIKGFHTLPKEQYSIIIAREYLQTFQDERIYSWFTNLPYQLLFDLDFGYTKAEAQAFLRETTKENTLQITDVVSLHQVHQAMMHLEGYSYQEIVAVASGLVDRLSVTQQAAVTILTNQTISIKMLMTNSSRFFQSLHTTTGAPFNLSEKGVYLHASYQGSQYKVGSYISITIKGTTAVWKAPILGFYQENTDYKIIAHWEYLSQFSHYQQASTAFQAEETIYLEFQHHSDLVEMNQYFQKHLMTRCANLQASADNTVWITPYLLKIGKWHSETVIDTVATEYLISDYATIKVLTAEWNQQLLTKVHIYDSDYPFAQLRDPNGGLLPMDVKGIYLSYALKAKLKLKIGDKVSFCLNDQLVLEGTFGGYYRPIDGVLAVIPQAYLYKLHDSPIEVLDELLDNPIVYCNIGMNHPADMATLLQQKMLVSNYELGKVYGDNSAFVQIYKIIRITEQIIMVLAGTILVLLIYNVGIISIQDRLNDIKIYKALGLPKRKLNWMNSVENNVTIIFGGILSVPLGLFLGRYIVTSIYDITKVTVIMALHCDSILILYIVAFIWMSFANCFINYRIQHLNLAKILKTTD